jgi:micrococcal nuclease
MRGWNCCPEKGQAFGNEAKKFTSDLCVGKNLEIEPQGRDRYGRTIGQVSLSIGRELNTELVRAGYAWWYKQYAPENRELQELENDARKNRRGLWSEDKQSTPWVWRRAKSAESP